MPPCGRRLRDGVGADFKGAFGAVLAAQGEDAIEGRRRSCSIRSFRQNDGQTIAARLHARIGGGVDQRFLGREKHPGRVLQFTDDTRRNQKAEIMRIGHKAGLERRGRRQMPAGRRKHWRDGRIGGRRLRRDRQFQVEFGTSGDADIGAGEPRCFGVERGGLSRRQRFRGSDRNQEIDGSGIAVIADAVLHEVLGHRPEDVPRREPGRQLPVDCRRQAGIAGVLPVDMPTRLDLEVEIDP